MPTVANITGLIKQATAEAGFELAGIAAVREFPELDYFADWIAAGRAGEMRYLEARDEAGHFKRSSLQRVFPWARSVIVCAMNYNTDYPLSVSRDREAQNASGWISRYAWSQRDYHDVILERLRRVEAQVLSTHPGIQTHCYVDTGPLVERVYARYAGVGWVGKNTCIINQRLGSWLFLGVIVTALELTSDIPAPDRCGTCTRCLDACPTNAFIGPHELDARRCISYLTIEKRGTIPEHLRDGMGRHVFGCDICQDVCPWNRRAPASKAPEFQPRAGLVNPDLVWLATISEDDFRRTFRGSPIRRAKRTGLRRNAVIAMGNSGERDYLPLLRELLEDADSVVAEHARWAIERIELIG